MERAPDDWLSAGDLAEYSFCPRAFYYRTHLPTPPVSADARRARIRGSRYHHRELYDDLVTERRVALYQTLVVASVVILAVGVLAWVFL